jgi:hypothetical protein
VCQRAIFNYNVLFCPKSNTYNHAGEIENGNIYLQLKATDHVHFVNDERAISFVINKKDLLLWLEEPLPVILIVYDAQKDQAYWLYIQAYFEQLIGFDIHQVQQTYTVHIPLANRINTRSFRRFARWKHAVLTQILNGRIQHNVEKDTL